jgi:phosphate transport system protein
VESYPTHGFVFTGNLAETARRYIVHLPVKKLIDIPRLGKIAQSMLREALDSFVKRDTRLAKRVLEQDDSLDDLKTQIVRELLTHILENPATAEPVLDLVLISRHLEADR